MNMRIIFPNSQEVNYSVPVIKYWKYDVHKLKSRGMYPLIPLQLFKLRKVLQKVNLIRSYPKKDGFLHTKNKVTPINSKKYIFILFTL
ncbi:hypothetical protein [Clostridium sp. Maddingley MBC34-26]|uniref:hypothetical protein n=2 Tax=Clostridium TaxID=1485 RepID=UPI0002976F25|nr:hypothetical protein [Clostridium sp. Maddingley MBC34-26]EKQ57336.1 MAG: hypothetical protein A370_01027 [Clostridium sp. Maddingley MBC34-26]